jgi:hypothetical protein
MQNKVSNERIKEYEQALETIEENQVQEIAKDHECFNKLGRPINSTAYKSIRYGEYLEEAERIVNEMKER